MANVFIDNAIPVIDRYDVLTGEFEWSFRGNTITGDVGVDISMLRNGVICYFPSEERAILALQWLYLEEIRTIAHTYLHYIDALFDEANGFTELEKMLMKRSLGYIIDEIIRRTTK